MSELLYEFNCGCRLPQTSEEIKQYDGLPALEIDWNNIPECEATWDLISSGKTRGVFQLESNIGRTYSKKLTPNTLELLSGLIAILRPGCLGFVTDGKSMTQHYIDRRHNLEPVTYLDNRLEQYTKESYGILVYQEQAINIAKGIAGFTPEEANALRKCVSGETMFVSNKRGWISINKLLNDGYDNDLFLVMDEFGQQSWEKIEKIWCTGEQVAGEVLCDSGMSIYATKHHQFLTDTGWKAKSRLNIDDRIISASSVEWLGEDVISENMAILIAGLITEGYFVKDNPSTFVSFEAEMLDIFENAYTNEFNEKPVRDEKNHHIRIKEKDKKIINTYMNYGLSAEKFIPDEMMGLTKETTRKFLGFMLNAEGGVTEKNGYFEYSSKSRRCIEQIHLLLLRFGINSYILNKWNSDYKCYYYRLYINDIVEQKKLVTEFGHILLNRKLNSIISNINRRRAGYSNDTVPQSIVTKLLNQYPKVGNYEGGSVYSQPITRARFNKLCILSGDIFWQNLANGKHKYAKLTSLNDKSKKIKVYDFTIANNKTPYIIANGMVIHNSIGKKKADELAALKDRFINGAIEASNLSKDKATELFDNIEASNRYSFNACLSPTTIVQTENGYEILDNVEVGCKILAPSDDGTKDEFVLVLNKFDNGEKEVFEVTLESGKTVICTLDHKFLCENGEILALKEIFLRNLKISCLSD